MLPHLSRKNPERDSFGVFTTKLLFCVDRAHLAILAHTLELDLAVDQSEQRIVLADTNVVARMNVRASLTNEDVARQNELTVRALGAEDSESRPFLVEPPPFLCAKNWKLILSIVLHLQNFDIIRIVIPQRTQCEHHAGENRLYGLFAFTRCGKG